MYIGSSILKGTEPLYTWALVFETFQKWELLLNDKYCYPSINKGGTLRREEHIPCQEVLFSIWNVAILLTLVLLNRIYLPLKKVYIQMS